MSKFFKLTFCNNSKDFDIVRQVGQVPLTTSDDPASALVRQMISQISPRGRKFTPRPTTGNGMMQAELLATSREYIPNLETVPPMRFYSYLVWGMRAVEINESDLSQYAKAATKTPLFDQLVAPVPPQDPKSRRFNFDEDNPPSGYSSTAEALLGDK